LSEADLPTAQPADATNDGPFGGETPCDDAMVIMWRRHIAKTQDYDVETTEEAWTYWIRTVAGVAFAGGAYGMPVFLLGGVIGFLIAGFFSIALVIPFAMAVRAVCGTWRHPLAAPCFGGLIGFISIAGWEPFEIRRPSHYVGFAIGPMLATLVGQAGGYIATRDSMIEMRLQQQRKAVAGRWQFSIGALLIGTASLALLFTLLRWWRPLELREVYTVALWLPWQVALLSLFARMGRRAAARLREIRRQYA